MSGTDTVCLIQTSLLRRLCYCISSTPTQHRCINLIVLWVRVDVNNKRASCPARARAGEWISTQVTCDLHRQHRGITLWSVASRKEATQRCVAVIHEHLKSSDLFVFLMWFQPANPDQTVILIGEKHPGFTFKYLWSQLLSMTDRQRHVRQASCDIMFSAPYRWRLYRKTNNRPLNFLFYICFLDGFLMFFFFYFLFHVVAPWQACGDVIFLNFFLRRWL